MICDHTKCVWVGRKRIDIVYFQKFPFIFNL